MKNGLAIKLKNNIYKNLIHILFLIIFLVFSSYLFLDIDKRFPDLQNYKNVILETSLYGIQFLDGSLGTLSIIFREPAWHLLVLIYSIFSYDSIYFIYTVSAFSIFIFSKFTLDHTKNPIWIIFLLNPMFIDLVLSQIRSALAMSLLLLAYTIKKPVLKIILSISATLVHSSMFIVLGIYMISIYLARIKFHTQKNINQLLKVFTTLMIAIVLALIISFGLDIILNFLGDRRFGNQEGSASVSFVFFWFVSGLLILFGKFKVNSLNNQWMVYFTSLMFTMAIFMAIFSAPSQRFIAFAIPIFLSCISFCQMSVKILIFILFIIQTSIQFYYWL